MAISKVGATGGENISPFSVAWPAGHQVGDVAILIVETANQPASLATPAGFTYIGGSGTGTGGLSTASRIDVWWCRATSTSMSSVGIGDSGNHQVALMVTFRGCVATDEPYDTNVGFPMATPGTSNSTTWGPVTTTYGNSWPIWLAVNGKSSGAAAWTSANHSTLGSLASNVQTYASGFTGNGGQCMAVWSSAAFSAATSTGTLTSSMSSSEVQASGTLVLIEARDESKSDGDTGSSAESQSITATRPVTADTGTGTEATAQSVTVKPTQADTGTGTESQSITATTPTAADTGTGTEAQSITALIKPTGDTSTATDTALAINTAIGDDAGQFTESTSPLAVKPTQADTGTGTETSLITGTPPATGDIGTATENAVGGSSVPGADASSPAGEGNAVTVKSGDTGQGTDNAVFAAKVFGSDSALGVDAAPAGPVGNDTATGSEFAFVFIEGVGVIGNRVARVARESRRLRPVRDPHTYQVMPENRLRIFGRDNRTVKIAPSHKDPERVYSVDKESG